MALIPKLPNSNVIPHPAQSRRSLDPANMEGHKVVESKQAIRDEGWPIASILSHGYLIDDGDKSVKINRFTYQPSRKGGRDSNDGGNKYYHLHLFTDPMMQAARTIGQQSKTHKLGVPGVHTVFSCAFEYGAVELLENGDVVRICDLRERFDDQAPVLSDAIVDELSAMFNKEIGKGGSKSGGSRAPIPLTIWDDSRLFSLPTRLGWQEFRVITSAVRRGLQIQKGINDGHRQKMLADTKDENERLSAWRRILDVVMEEFGLAPRLPE